MRICRLKNKFAPDASDVTDGYVVDLDSCPVLIEP